MRLFTNRLDLGTHLLGQELTKPELLDNTKTSHMLCQYFRLTTIKRQGVEFDSSEDEDESGGRGEAVSEEYTCGGGRKGGRVIEVGLVGGGEMQKSGSGVEPLAGEGKAAEDEDEDEASDEESVSVDLDVE